MSMISMPILIILVILFAGAVGLIIYALSNQIKSLKTELKNSDENKVLMEWLKDMKTSVDKNSDVLEKKLQDQNQTLLEQLNSQRRAMSEQTKLIWERLENSSKVIQQVQKELGGISEFGKDMKDLSNILKSPKLRGGLGEQFLYEILENTLPKDLFKIQYKFKDGTVCDAIILTDRGSIPIDSKFPMENFKEMITSETQEARDGCKKKFVKDVKLRIDEIASKYIHPDEGTSDFAVMYVPSENVFYELVVNSPEIEEYSRTKKIFITSPNTLTYQMRAIFVAYQQGELQKHAGEILKSLGGIKVEAQKFGEELSVLGRHITNTYKSMDNVSVKFFKLFGRIERVQELGGDTEHNKDRLEAPHLEKIQPEKNPEEEL